MRLAAIALMVVALSACQTAQPIVSAGTSDAAHALYTQLTETMKTCWFGGDPAFAGYVYSPEINGDAPRILIVPKEARQGRPVLVIEPKGGTTADVYGPLLAEPAGNRVRSDLGRWLKGATSCA